MATANQTTASAKTAATKKEPVAVVTRINEQMKRAALTGKISKDELDTVANLAGALKTFLSA